MKFLYYELDEVGALLAESLPANLVNIVGSYYRLPTQAELRSEAAESQALLGEESGFCILS